VASLVTSHHADTDALRDVLTGRLTRPSSGSGSVRSELEVEIRVIGTARNRAANDLFEERLTEPEAFKKKMLRCGGWNRGCH
jgi:hypothetical protein